MFTLKFVSNYLQFHKMDPAVRKISQIYFLNEMFRTFTTFLLSTYLVLYFLEIVTIAQLGVLISVRFISQMLLDYPSGSLGDHIGQRNVLLLAFSGHLLSMLIFIYAHTFNLLLIGIIIQGMSLSQESGALSSWYDNQYKNQTELSEEGDKIYGLFMGSIITYSQVVIGISIIIGGIIASIYSRQTLLQFALFSLILNFCIIALTITNPTILMDQNEKPTYFQTIKSGLIFLKNEPGLLRYFIGISIYTGATSGLWFELMLFPYFFSYSGNDFLTGVLRSSIFVSSIALSIIGVRLAGRINNLKKYLWLNYFCIAIVWFGLILIFTTLIPANGSFNPIGFVVIIIYGALATIPITIYTILDRKIQFAVIPNDLRNSMYSVVPTLFTIFGAIFAAFGGLVLEEYGFYSGLALILLLNSFALILIQRGLGKIEYESVSKSAQI